MITLFTAGPGFDLPERSPYVTKTEVQLRMAGLDYRKAPARPDVSPKGQLPWIEDEGELIADSHFIRLHLEDKYGLDFDEALTPAERAQAWAVERMVENHFGWTVVETRWLVQENFDKGPAAFFADAPDAIRAQIQRDVQAEVAANMRAVGVGRHSAPEILDLGVRSLTALSALIGDKPYLMGERPCGSDAIAFAMLAALYTPYFDSALRREALRFDNLKRYVDRLMGQFYPDFGWSPLVLERRVAA